MTPAVFMYRSGTYYPVIYLHSEDGSTTPQILQLDLSFDFYGTFTEPELCQVYGYLLDSDANPLAGGTVSARLLDIALQNGNFGSAVAQSATSAADGYFELRLIRTEGGTTRYLASVPGRSNIKISVPDQESVQLATLV